MKSHDLDSNINNDDALTKLSLDLNNRVSTLRKLMAYPIMDDADDARHDVLVQEITFLQGVLSKYGLSKKG